MSHAAADPLRARIEHDGHFLYFAYGSNLCEERLRLVNPSAVSVCVAVLDNYRLVFNGHTNTWCGANATTIEAAGEHVFGVVYRMSSSDLANIDRQEALGVMYERIEVRVRRVDVGEEHNCVVYVKLNRHLPEAAPSPHYKRVIVCGAIEKGLPDEYVRMLEGVEDNGYRGKVKYRLRCLEALNGGDEHVGYERRESC